MNEGYIYRETIAPAADGRPIERYLVERYGHSSAEEWRAHIAAGRVTLDGKRPAVDTLLRTGQQLAWHRPPWREPGAPLDFDVLYDDGDIVVVDKPAGLPTLPGGGYLQHTLIHQLQRVAPAATPMHRLGRFTTGAVLCARTLATRTSLAEQFAAQTIGKRYRALARGKPAADRFEVDAPIGPVPYAPLGTLHAAHAEGKASRSRVVVVERRAGSFLCDVTIESGRPHQIRIHLAYAGHPLVGDPLYVRGGGPAPDGTALPGDRGYHLHAAEIAFVAPTSHERRIVTAPTPLGLRRRA